MIGIAELKKMYDNAWKLFVQPPKRRYNPNELSDDPTIVFDSLMYVPFTIRNAKDKNLKCHAFIPTKQSNFQSMRTNFIIYTHAQGSNALEGNFLLPVCDKLGIGLCLFDFAGSGNSDGDFVTLGISEANDLDLIIFYLKTNYKVQNIGLWGRSMGAVSILLYAHNPSTDITYAIYDVPYYELESSGVHFAKNKLKVSAFLTKIVLNFISNKIKEEIGFDIFETKTGDVCKEIRIPATLIASYNDELVPFEDFEKIFNNYGSRNIKMLITTKTHADHREPHIIAEAIQHMVNHLLNTNYTLSDIDFYMKKDHNEVTAKRHSTFRNTLNSSVLSNADLHSFLKPPSNGLMSSLNQSNANLGSSRRYSSLLKTPSIKRDCSLIPINKYREQSNGILRSKSPNTRGSYVDVRNSKRTSVFGHFTEGESILEETNRDSNTVLDEFVANPYTPPRTSHFKNTRSKSPLNFDIRKSSEVYGRKN